MRNDIYQKLIQIARAQTLISYDDLNIQLSLGLNFEYPSDRELIGHWLGEISEYEVKAGRHMLSAMVVHKDGDGYSDPGKGFYKFAIDLGIYSGGDNIKFWSDELNWLYSYWSTH